MPCFSFVTLGGLVVGLALWYNASTPVVHPRQSYDYGQMAINLYRAGRYEDAEKYFLTEISKGKISMEIWYDLGNVYFKQQKYQDAVTAYTVAYSMKSDPDAEFNLGLAEKMLGRKPVFLPL